jgi:hypothetical protein
MKHLKRYKAFLEDGTAAANASTTAGMGAVSNSQPGDLPGQTGTSGSGDVSFYMLDKKGKKIKKGTPSEVSDARYLEPAKGITKVKESKLDSEEVKMVEDCLQELYDMGFEVNEYNLDSEDEEYDIDDDNYGTFKSQELRISVYKQIEKIWRGNLNLRYNFDRNEVYQKNISTLRAAQGKLEPQESEIVEVSEDACHKLINHLEYTTGVLTIYFEAPGQAVNWNKERLINVNIHIVLNRNVYPVDESYNDVQEYTNQIMSLLKEFNIRPVVLNHIIDQYQDQISEYYEEGKDLKFFVDEIVKDMELDSGGFMAHKVGSAGYSKVIKYL